MDQKRGRNGLFDRSDRGRRPFFIRPFVPESFFWASGKNRLKLFYIRAYFSTFCGFDLPYRDRFVLTTKGRIQKTELFVLSKKLIKPKNFLGQ